jgi:hypothetical protein
LEGEGEERRRKKGSQRPQAVDDIRYWILDIRYSIYEAVF